MVLVSRWDVLWSRPLLLSRIDLSGHAYSLPTYCTHESHVDARSKYEMEITAIRKAVCGGSISKGCDNGASGGGVEGWGAGDGRA